MMFELFVLVAISRSRGAANSPEFGISCHSLKAGGRDVSEDQGVRIPSRGRLNDLTLGRKPDEPTKSLTFIPYQTIMWGSNLFQAISRRLFG